MKRTLIMWIIVGGCMRMSWAQTETRLAIMPYVGTINYSDTLVKQDSTVVGAYTYFGYGTDHALEADFGLTRINYDSPTMSRIEQTSLALVYSNYSIPNYKLRIGAHTIQSDDETTEGTVLFGGVHTYQPDQYSVGVDAYYSMYKEHVPDLDAFQATGTLGFYLNEPSEKKRWYSETKGHFIQLSEDIGYDDKTFTSVEQSLYLICEDWTFRIFGWVGKQVFGVQNNGFVVYNLAERHQGALGGSIRWSFVENTAIKLEIAQTRFQELNNPETARGTTIFFFLEHTF